MYRRVIAICMGCSIERQDGEDFERRVSGHFQIGVAPDTFTDRQSETSLQKEKGVVSRMKQRHNPDARAYHEYYLNQAGREYPVYVGTRYQ